MHDGHLHVKELDGNVSVPVARMHCWEPTGANFVSQPGKWIWEQCQCCWRWTWAPHRGCPTPWSTSVSPSSRCSGRLPQQMLSSPDIIWSWSDTLVKSRTSAMNAVVQLQDPAIWWCMLNVCTQNRYMQVFICKFNLLECACLKDPLKREDSTQCFKNI